LRVTTSSGSSANKVKQALESKFPQAQFPMPSASQQVGATVGAGNPALGHHRLAAGLFGILCLCGVPL
jgi:hypothetical protein